MEVLQHVKDDVRYSAMLIVAGMSDMRITPWNGGKLAARLQTSSASGKPVLLRIDFDAGHGIGCTRKQGDDLRADTYTFVLWQANAQRYRPV